MFDNLENVATEVIIHSTMKSSTHADTVDFNYFSKIANRPKKENKIIEMKRPMKRSNEQMKTK